ncbi:hypothetical protein BH23CHL2_BH23CHL2_18390 [soil metagenome]
MRCDSHHHAHDSFLDGRTRLHVHRPQKPAAVRTAAETWHELCVPMMLHNVITPPHWCDDEQWERDANEHY